MLTFQEGSQWAMLTAALVMQRIVLMLLRTLCVQLKSILYCSVAMFTSLCTSLPVGCIHSCALPPSLN